MKTPISIRLETGLLDALKTHPTGLSARINSKLQELLKNPPCFKVPPVSTVTSVSLDIDVAEALLHTSHSTGIKVSELIRQTAEALLEEQVALQMHKLQKEVGL